jgi:hypothetical protein
MNDKLLVEERSYHKLRIRFIPKVDEQAVIKVAEDYGYFSERTWVEPSFTAFRFAAYGASIHIPRALVSVLAEKFPSKVIYVTEYTERETAYSIPITSK